MRHSLTSLRRASLSRKVLEFHNGWLIAGSTPGEGAKMEPMPYIPECEFIAYFDRVRQALARQIAYSGLSLSEIARATRMKWDTVYAASQGRPIRMENAARIQYLMKTRSRQTDSVVKLNNQTE